MYAFEKARSSTKQELRVKHNGEEASFHAISQENFEYCLQLRQSILLPWYYKKCGQIIGFVSLVKSPLCFSNGRFPGDKFKFPGLNTKGNVILKEYA